MKSWRSSKVEASFILPIPPAGCDKRERQMNRRSKVPVLPSHYYGTKILYGYVLVM